MNWLDIVFVCLAGIGFAKGLFDGVIKQVVSLIALVAAIFFCTKAAVFVRGYIVAAGFPEESVTIVSNIVGFALIMGVVILAGRVVHRVIGMTPLGVLNHLAGGVFGLCVMALFVSLLLNVIEVVDRHSVLVPRELKVESRFYEPLREILPSIYPGDLCFWKK
jgi:membrane protein required for colicin V production